MVTDDLLCKIIHLLQDEDVYLESARSIMELAKIGGKFYLTPIPSANGKPEEIKNRLITLNIPGPLVKNVQDETSNSSPYKRKRNVDLICKLQKFSKRISCRDLHKLTSYRGNLGEYRSTGGAGQKTPRLG